MIDEILSKAIRKAVGESSQPEALAEAIQSWMQDIAKGEDNPSDITTSNKRLERIYSFTSIEVSGLRDE